MDQLSEIWRSLSRALWSSPETPLIIAVLKRQTETVRQLLASGADTSATDYCGYNALHHASNGEGYTEIVLLLLDSGAKINAKTDRGIFSTGLTALALAVASEEEVVGKILMARGAEVGHDDLSDSGMKIHDRWRAELRCVSQF